MHRSIDMPEDTKMGRCMYCTNIYTLLRTNTGRVFLSQHCLLVWCIDPKALSLHSQWPLIHWGWGMPRLYINLYGQWLSAIHQRGQSNWDRVRDWDKHTEQKSNIPCAQLSCYQTDIMHTNVYINFRCISQIVLQWLKAKCKCLSCISWVWPIQS